MVIAVTSYRRKPAKRAKVAVVVVVELPPDDERLQACMECLSVQTYPNFDVLGVDNREGTLTLGDARNRAVKNAHASYILFLDQLDMIEPDAIASMVDLFELNRKEAPHLQHLTIGSLVQNKYGERFLATHPSPGMYTRRFLVDNPFPTDAMDFPDPYMRDLLKNEELPRTIHIGHHFGHVYREAPFRKDGFRS